MVKKQDKKTVITLFLMLLLILTIFFSKNVFSEELKGYYYSGEPISFNGKTFYGYLDEGQDSLLLKTDSFSKLLSLGRCEEQDFIEMCFLGVEKNDYNKIKVDSNGNFIYPFNISLKTTGPELDVSLNLDKNTVDVDEEVKGKITLKNKGNRVSEDNYIKLFYNSSCKVYDCKDCIFGFDKQNYIIIKNSYLDVDEEKNIDFKVKLLKSEDCNFYSYYNYSYEGKTVSKEKSLGVLKIFKPYNLDFNYNSNLNTGDYSEGYFKIKNLGGKDLYVNVTVKKNESLKYYDLNNSYSFIIKPGEEKKVDFKTLSFESKTYTTKFNFTINYDEKSYEENKNMKVSFKSSSLDVKYTFDKDNAISEEKGNFYLSLKNNNEDSFKNIVVKVEGIINDSKNISVLNPNSFLKVFDEKIVYPKTDVIKNYYENITIIYNTIYGEEKTLKKNIKIKVYPLNKSYSIKHQVVKDKKGLLNFKIIGKNNVDSKVKVEKVYSKIKNLKFIVGNLENNNVIVERKDTVLYGFTAENESENYYVNTTATISFNNKKVNVSNLYLVGDINKIENSTTKKTEEKTEKNEKNSETTQEKKENNNNENNNNKNNNENNDKNKNNNKEKKDFITVIIEFFKDLFTF